MRKGIQSDEAIKRDCWEMSAQVDFNRSKALHPQRKPLKYQNIREPVYVPQQVPRSIHDLATNIYYLKPKTSPKPDDVMVLTKTLVKSMTDYDKILSKKRLMEMKDSSLIGDIIERVPKFVSLPFGDEPKSRLDFLASGYEMYTEALNMLTEMAQSGVISEEVYRARAEEYKKEYEGSALEISRRPGQSYQQIAEEQRSLQEENMRLGITTPVAALPKMSHGELIAMMDREIEMNREVLRQ